MGDLGLTMYATAMTLPSDKAKARGMEISQMREPFCSWRHHTYLVPPSDQVPVGNEHPEEEDGDSDGLDHRQGDQLRVRYGVTSP
jgi:hypothetical protein